MKAYLFLIIVFLSLNNLNGQEFIFVSTQDLNKDNIDDTIRVEIIDTYKFRLFINNYKIEDRFDDGNVDGFKIIDIDKLDKYKEIAVHTSGPSNDDEYMIYCFNGSEIIFMNHLSRWPEFIGNGIIYLNDWEGFWSCRDKYVLDYSERKLKHIEQFAYYVGKKFKIEKGFKIYKEKELINDIAFLEDNSEIELILCDKTDREYFEYRYLIKSQSGLLGWANFKSIYENSKISMAD
jgi:hypothetical protein